MTSRGWQLPLNSQVFTAEFAYSLRSRKQVQSSAEQKPTKMVRRGSLELVEFEEGGIP